MVQSYHRQMTMGVRYYQSSPIDSQEIAAISFSPEMVFLAYRRFLAGLFRFRHEQSKMSLAIAWYWVLVFEGTPSRYDIKFPISFEKADSFPAMNRFSNMHPEKKPLFQSPHQDK
jgi:hypothetical protein